MDKNYLTILELVEREFTGDTTHTLDHIMRVFTNAMEIASDDPGVDMDVLKIAVLLHDVARIKEDADNSGKTDHALLGAEIAERILRKLKYPKDKIRKVKHCIQTHRYRSRRKPKSKEARILFDADKIDLLGTIGIARSYMIAGEYRQKLYSFTQVNEYIIDNLIGAKPNGRVKDISKHAPNLEFETKMRNIPDKLFTLRAKRIANQRIKFMEEFFTQVRSEITGDA